MCLGMKTFGMVMIIGNLAFVYPETVRDVVGWLCRPFLRQGSSVLAEQGSRGTLRATSASASVSEPPKRESLAVAASR